jgi:hypothetical protein
MIEKPKKERRFLKALGRVGEILLQEVLIKVGSSLIKRIGGKKQIPSILFLFLSISLYGQFPININKQRLGFQTTADGLVWRGSLSDTASIQPVSNQNAWVILDTVNLKIYSFDFTSNVWNALPQGTNIDTTSLSNRIDLKLNISDTAAMLLPYFRDTDTSLLNLTSRFNLKVNISDTASMLLPYLSKADTTSMLLPYFRDGDTSLLNLTNRFNTKLNISDTAAMLLNYKNTLNLKLNISDTAAMLLPYATKEYADTTGRLYARQDYTTGVTTSTLTWTQTDTLIPGGVTFIQVYRNGQILLPSQYTVPTSTSVVISASSFKVNDNYTVIFPRGGGAGSGGGSGSLTSISGGTGIIVNPNPITTTGTVSADLSVLMELTDTTLLNLNTRFLSKLNLSDTAAMLTPYFRDADTTLLNLTNRFNTKLNISDTTNMLSPYFRDGDTSLLNLTNRFALKLNAADTASLSTRIDAKGTGTVTSIATGYGLSGGTITTSGTLLLDSATVFTRIRDSIVDVAIGNDTIKILKQEYAPALTSILTWTITPKFPIQLKAYILVFRNGQLLNNDQYNLTDTNKITIVSTSFKVGANYTVATVSGIGSVGTGVFPNPVYPEAGIALSTGSTWASSIPNNSTNWNTAYNDKVNSLAVTGTTTKTITLTQQDGGTVSGNFADNGSVTSVDMTVPTGLAISGQPITTSGTLALSYASGYAIPTDIKQNEWNTAYNDKINNAVFTGTDTKTLTLTQVDGGTFTPTFTDLQGVTGVTAGTGLTGGTISTTGTLAVDFGVVAPLANPTFTGTVGGITKSMVGLGNVDNTSDANKPISTATQTALNLKQNTLNGTGFVKASGTNITYDNSSYLRTGLADSTYLKLTGGTINGPVAINDFLFTYATTNPITISSFCGQQGSPVQFGTLTGNYVDRCTSAINYILLPDPRTTNTGRIITITKSNSGSPAIIISFIQNFQYNSYPKGANDADITFLSQLQWMTIQSNGTNWYIISKGTY